MTLTDEDLQAIAGIVEVKIIPMKKSLKQLKRTVNLIAKLLDSEQVVQRKRIDRIENYLDLPPFEQKV